MTHSLTHSFWLLNPQTVAMNVTNAHGLAAGGISLAPGLLHADFGLQMMLSTSLFSNAVRVTVGGGL